MRGEIHREPARPAVHVRDDSARFERRGMDALELDVLVDLDVRFGQRRVVWGAPASEFVAIGETPQVRGA